MTARVQVKDREEDLPEGWQTARLVDVTLDVKSIKPESEPVRTFRYVDIGSVDNASNRIIEPSIFLGKDAPSRARRPIRAGDVLFSNVRTYLRNIAFVTERDNVDVCSTGFTVLRAGKGVLPRFLFFAILRDAFIDEVSETQTGTHYPATSDAAVRSIEIPLPPLTEQKRIVEAIERLTARVDAARARLAAAPAILKRFRQAVLAAACSGRLTEDWREDNPDTEPAHVGLGKFDQAWKPRRAKSTQSNEDDLDLELMPGLPETWAYRRADTIVAPGAIITYGIVLPGPEVPDGVPYVRQQDIQDGGILVEQLRRTTPDIAAKHSRSVLAEGDVLLCIIRHLRVATVPRGLDGANLTQGTVRMRPSEVISGPYLARFLASQHAQAWMKQRHFGMSMPRINVEHARAIPVAVPPMAEQAEIVRRVESLMKLANAIERRLAAAQARADKLTQSILAKAFRGNLVTLVPDEVGRRVQSAMNAGTKLCELGADSHTSEPRDEANGQTSPVPRGRKGGATRRNSR